jgi:hypothetical protein
MRAMVLGAAVFLAGCGNTPPYEPPGSGGSTSVGGTGANAAGTSARAGNGGQGGSFAAPMGGLPNAAGSSAGKTTGGGRSSGGAPSSGTAGVPGLGGVSGAGRGAAGDAGGSSAGGSGAMGECCSDGDCLCHGPVPPELTSAPGPFMTTTFTVATGTVHYPTDADPPFAAVALCGGFLNTGPEMEAWGPFFASYGIVTVITTTGAADFPDLRAQKLLASIDALETENTKSGSPLNGKLAGRYGTSGYSMGGGGTTLASVSDPTLRSSLGLAPWEPTGENVNVPTLLLCGASDTVAPCSMAESAYTGIDASVPKMMMTIPATAHLEWFGPKDAGDGMSGETALAFEKVYLEGDERWKPLLMQARGTVATNIQ